MNRHRGFTILELMTIVAITAALGTIGIPGFNTLTFNNRLTTQLNLFSSSLALARSEAVKVNQRVVVCPSDDGLTCDTTLTFDKGWLVFVDRGGTDFQVDNDGAGNPLDDPCGVTAGDDAADDCILNYVPGLTVVTMTLQTDIAANRISYNGLGSSSSAGMFVICDSRDNDNEDGDGIDDYAKAVVVSNTGRTSVRTTKIDGSAIACDPPF